MSTRTATHVIGTRDEWLAARLALLEADDPATLERIARRLKMDFIQAPGEKRSR